jgi:hypothetical protein
MSDEYAEQFPLSPIDDLMIHQTPDPIRIMWSSDPRAYERYWTVCHDDTGDLLVVVGGTFYPSLDGAEAYAIVNWRGRHAAVRANRPLGVDRTNMHVGPIRPTVVRGLREWRYELTDNPFGVRFDFRFHDEKRQVYRDPGSIPVDSGYPPGRQREVTSGFEGFGTVEGWFEIEGQRVEVTRATMHGTRDRHWGVRTGVGGPDQLLGDRPPRGQNGYQFVDFGSWSIWGDRVFYPYGDERPGMGRLTSVKRRLSFEPGTHIFAGGEVSNTLSTGETKQVTYQRLGQQTAYLRCGLYGGPNGGTPGAGLWQGMFGRDEVLEGEVVELTEAGRTALIGLDEHHCAVSCDDVHTTGLFQAYDTIAYDRCTKGIPGWEFL